MRMDLRKAFSATALIAAAALCMAATPARALTGGANLPWEGYGHSFGADGIGGFATTYSSSTTQAAMDDLKAKHLTICRVFLFDDLEGVIANGNFNTIITPSSQYITNLTDFVNRANADGITVYATMFNAWDFVSFPPAIRSGRTPSTIFGNSALYATNGPIQTVARALAGKQVIWDFMNEGNNMAQFWNGSAWQDLISGGWVSLNGWISNGKSALRSGGANGMFTFSCNDPNVLSFNTGTSNSSDLLNRNNLDFYDCHFYNDTGTVSVGTSTFNDGKQVFVGEFGPAATWASTGVNKVTLVDNFWNSAVSHGISAILIWSYLDDGAGFGSQNSTQLTELSVKAGGGGGTADFSLSANPSSLTVNRGSNGTSTITVNKLNGFNSSVSLSATGMPSGVTASFNPGSTTTTSVLTLTASSTATTGSSTIVVHGASGSLNHTVNIALTVGTGGGGNLVANGTYTIVSLNSNMAVDDPGSSTTLGTQQEQWTINGGNNQKWTLTNLGSNVVELINVSNGLALGVRGSSMTNGAVVEQNTWANANNQKWTIAAATTAGFFTLKNVNSNQMLDVVGASKTAGALLDQWPANGNSNQAWKFQ